MGTFFILHSEAGIVLPVSRREQTASQTLPFATADISSISSDYLWRNRFASELDGDSGVTVHDDGATVLRGYVGEISYSN